MRKNENTENIEGRIYQFDLAEKITGETSKHPGTPFISGTLEVAVSEEMDNIIPVHYTYVAPTYNNGKANNTYSALKQIIASGKTVMTDGYDGATVVRLNPSYAVNDFFPEGQDTPVSQPRNEGGFVTITNEASIHPSGDIGRNKFSVDLIIFEVNEVVPDEGESYATIKGITFDFRNAAFPITLTARNKEAVKYFLDLDASKSNPVYTKVWGKIINTYIKEERTTESAFGPGSVDIITRRNREYLITGANPIPYEFDTDATITAAELTKVLQDREIYLAEVKKSNDEWRANKNAAALKPAASATPTIPQGGAFKF